MTNTETMSLEHYQRIHLLISGIKAMAAVYAH